MIDLSEYPDITYKYKIANRIGSGGFKTAYIARDDKDEQFVLFKFHKNINLGSIEHEINNIIRFKNYFEKKGKCNKLIMCPVDIGIHEGKLTIITNFFKGKNLWDYLKSERLIDFDEAIKIMISILKAIHELHKIKFIHFDIKPENIMIAKQNGEYSIGIIDIDSGCFFDEITECLNNPTSTCSYNKNIIYNTSLKNVKINKNVNYIYNVDIYALGQTFLDILSSTEVQYQSKKYKKLIKFINKMSSISDEKNQYYKNITQIIKDFNGLVS